MLGESQPRAEAGLGGGGALLRRTCATGCRPRILSNDSSLAALCVPAIRGLRRGPSRPAAPRCRLPAAGRSASGAAAASMEVEGCASAAAAASAAASAIAAAATAAACWVLARGVTDSAAASSCLATRLGGGWEEASSTSAWSGGANEPSEASDTKEALLRLSTSSGESEGRPSLGEPSRARKPCRGGGGGDAGGGKEASCSPPSAAATAAAAAATAAAVAAGVLGPACCAATAAEKLAVRLPMLDVRAGVRPRPG